MRNDMYELDDLNMDEAVLKQYSGEEEKITISEKIDNKRIVSVGAFAFSEHREIVEITLPETVVRLVHMHFTIAGILHQ